MIENTPPTRVLHSAEDKSVNFVWDVSYDGALEARYVRRDDAYFIVYLSSQSGCNQACRFCHLTATKQVSFDQATLEDYLLQAQTVLSYYDNVVASGDQVRAQKVHFNWMARGEPLLNPVVTERTVELYMLLEQEAAKRGLQVKFNISSIIPASVNKATLERVLSHPNACMFYSLYSMEENFRKRWLPKAQDPRVSLDILAELQREHGIEIVLHWAFIEGENDSVDTIENIKREVQKLGINARFNLVRYNPYSERQGRESQEVVLHERFESLKQTLDARTTRIVPRVGFDVKASCGMFVHPSESQS